MKISSHILILIVLVSIPRLAAADIVTGLIVDNSGLAVAGATVETLDHAATFVTTASGTFSLSLPAGTYSFQVIPPNGSLLAPTVLANVVVNGTANLGLVALSPGFLLSGVVTDTSGVAVINGDLDVFDDLTGIKLSIDNDKTSATGTFSLRVPTGLLRLRAEPATGQLLVAQAQTINLTADLSVGTVVLPVGFILTGTVIDSSSNLPLAGVDIDVDDVATGERIQTPGDNTDSLGVFSVIVPSGLYVVSFEPKKGVQIVVATRRLALVFTSTRNMGTIPLEPGIALNGVIVDGAGFPVTNADIDVRQLAGDTHLFTPGDKTGPDGQFFLVIPSGSHRIIYQPLLSTSLVAQGTAFTTYTAPTNLGTITLAAGHVLTGQVTAFNGIPQFDTEVVVRDSVSGALVEISEKKADINGNYTAIVPSGTYDITFETRKASIARDKTIPGVMISGASNLDVVLELVSMLIYVDDPAYPGPQFVPVSAPELFVNIGIYNPGGVTAGTFMDVEYVGPFGTITPILTNSPTILGAGQYIIVNNLGIPSISAAGATRGQPHRFRIRLRDPFDNSVVDVDEFVFIPL